MKLKLIAAALAVGFAAQANAALIDNGAGGNGGLFFNVWDATGSYTRNLGMDLNTFENTVNGAGFASLVFNADSALSSWISGKSSFSWNIMANDNQGAKRVLETAAQGATLTPKATNQVSAGTLQANTLISNIDLKLSAAVDSATFTTADAGYIGKASGGIANINTNIGWPASGVLGSIGNNSYATGLRLVEANGNASGSAVVPNTTLGAANGVYAYFDAANTLHIEAAPQVPAVPEPETYAMFLAGLGLMGAIARRRLNRA